MDELGTYAPYNSMSAISGRWKGEHEVLCAMKRRARDTGAQTARSRELGYADAVNRMMSISHKII